MQILFLICDIYCAGRDTQNTETHLIYSMLPMHYGSISSIKDLKYLNKQNSHNCFVFFSYATKVLFLPHDILLLFRLCFSSPWQKKIHGSFKKNPAFLFTYFLRDIEYKFHITLVLLSHTNNQLAHISSPIRFSLYAV